MNRAADWLGRSEAGFQHARHAAEAGDFNGWPAGAPHDDYTQREAREALADAHSILAFARCTLP